MDTSNDPDLCVHGQHPADGCPKCIEQYHAMQTAAPAATPTDGGDGKLGDAFPQDDWIDKALSNTDWIGPAAHFKPTEEVIQTKVLRALAKQHRGKREKT